VVRGTNGTDFLQESCSETTLLNSALSIRDIIVLYNRCSNNIDRGLRFSDIRNRGNSKDNLNKGNRNTKKKGVKWMG
jgi:hypothetical protein